MAQPLLALPLMLQQLPMGAMMPFCTAPRPHRPAKHISSSAKTPSIGRWYTHRCREGRKGQGGRGVKRRYQRASEREMVTKPTLTRASVTMHARPHHTALLALLATQRRARPRTTHTRRTKTLWCWNETQLQGTDKQLQAPTQLAAHGLLSLPLPPHTHLCLCHSSAMCMCVFDGHGPVGEKVSQHFMRRVPQLAFALLSASPPATAAEALTGAILQTERELLASTRVPHTSRLSAAPTRRVLTSSPCASCASSSSSCSSSNSCRERDRLLL